MIGQPHHLCDDYLVYWIPVRDAPCDTDPDCLRRKTYAQECEPVPRKWVTRTLAVDQKGPEHHQRHLCCALVAQEWEASPWLLAMMVDVERTA